MPNETEKTQNVILANGLKPLNLSVQNGVGMECANSEKWRRWKQKFEIYCDANDIEKIPEKKQIAILLNAIGDEGLEIYNSFNVQRSTETLKSILEKFDNKFNACKNTTVERYNFFTRYQREETLDDYVTILNNLAASCKFDLLKESLVKDMFIIGIKNEQIKEKLLQHEKIQNVNEAVTIAKTIELSGKRSKQIGEGESSQVQAISKYVDKNQTQRRHLSRPKFRSTSRSRPNQSASRERSGPGTLKHNFNNTACRRCGQVHRVRCPAQGKVCTICKKPNHFAQYCFFKNKKVSAVSSSHNYIPNSQSDNAQQRNDQSDFIIGSINNKIKSSHNNWKINIKCYNHTIMCQIDTGADINVISLSTIKYLENVNDIEIPIHNSHNKIFTFSGQLIDNLGSVMLTCSFDNGRQANIQFMVVKCECSTILGWKTCEDCEIVKRVFELTNQDQRSVNSLLDTYSDTFEGLGCLPHKAQLHLDTSVTPKVCPVRRIPYALHQKLKNELDRMEKLEVIEKVTVPTDWVNSIVPIEKPNGQLRICLDPRSLNKAIKRPHFPYPTLEDLRSKIAGASVFSKLDANSGYWMIQLDEQSSQLCTFNTQFGRYKFLRLPYGINSSGEIFHRVMTDLFGDLPGVLIFVDDILVYGSNQAEHNVRLENVLKKAREVNLKFNKSKCIFDKSQITYVGHVFNKNGISADSSKIEAIIDMPSPETVKDLQRFLGMVNYLGSYIQNLAHETSLLRSLLRKQNIWQWTQNHEKEFIRLKELISQSPVLVHYDVNKPIRMSVDASKNAVGAVIFHGKNPIAYSSKSLTNTQQNYAQIEKELYAILYGCKKFHQYIYGKTVQVETDHQPLVTLFKKPLSDVPARLQRMMIALQTYDLIVSYVKGTEMYVSDTLSRAPISHNTSVEKFDCEELDSNIVCQVKLLTSNLAITQKKLQQIKDHTKSDMTLLKLQDYYLNGWPNSKTQCDPITLPYWNIRDEIHAIDEIIFKSQSVIIPKSMRSEILNILHEGHMGIEKTKNLARGLVFWPNIYHDIELKVRQCETCMTYSPNKTKETLLSYEQPRLPWQRLATDLFDYNNKKYLLVVDYYSNYIEIVYLNTDHRSQTIIQHLKSIFARHGIPIQLVSDGGPPYNSQEFHKFLNDWDIEHIMSSPHFPRSNGLAEVSVKIVKNILRKCQESGTDFHLGLLQYRTTPRENIKSPSELLMSRKLRTRLPTHIDSLKPKIVKFSDHSKNKSDIIQKREAYYNKSAKAPEEFQQNDLIFFKKNPNDINWIKGTIVNKTNYPRSYIVKSTDGVVYRRNTQHIKLFKSCLSNSESNIKTNKSSHSMSKHEPAQSSRMFTNKNYQSKAMSNSHMSSQNNEFMSSQSNKIDEREESRTFYYVPEYLVQDSSHKNNINISQDGSKSDSINESFRSVQSGDHNLSMELSSPTFGLNENNCQSSPINDKSDNTDNINNLPNMPSTSDNTQEPRYSSRGRLLKKTNKLDL